MSGPGHSVANIYNTDDLVSKPAENTTAAVVATCPVGSVWHSDEYNKLRGFDRETGLQPNSLFFCHLGTREDRHHERPCAGWAGCHGGQLLSLRWPLLARKIDEAIFQAAITYQSPVPLFASGTEAADHGQADIETPVA